MRLRTLNLIVLGLVALTGLQVASGTTVVMVLKEGADFRNGGSLDAAFVSVSAANVVPQMVNDTSINSNPAAYYNILGSLASTQGDCLFKFDLSDIPAGATIYKAQLRLRAGNGNTAVTGSRIITHDWTEALACNAGPDHPTSPNRTWGPASNALFSSADRDTPASFNSVPSGAAWLVKDVTSDVQAFVVGTLPNYGWYVNSGNHGLLMSENITRADRPALFVSFEPGFDMAPLAVANLTAGDPQLHEITLTWSAPLDDNGTDTMAAGYDIRYSTSAIDAGNWDLATQVAGEPTPALPGSAESMVVPNLAPDTPYYFAIKSWDLAGNISNLSNVAMGQTIPDEKVAPAAAADLHAVDVRGGNLTLNWTATGDDGTADLATYYDIRMSSNQITPATFDSATVVAHSIMPAAPGSPESQFISSLTPGATYWFAIKVGDEVYNWSAATVIQVALPLDTTAPAAIADLSVSAVAAFSATVSWTASGDDASVGTAAGYEIRYSTAPITAGTWDNAAVMPNTLSPQSVGSAEQFAITGMQPGTAYYLAIKVKDEAGNLSGLSNVAAATTSADPRLRRVTTVTIAEKQSVTTAGYPVLLSQGFKKGDVADNVTVRIAGQYLPTQTDVKVRYPDGSVKHALVSFLLPSLSSHQTVSVDILAGGPNANQQPMSKVQLLAKDFDARMTVTLNGVTTIVSAREMLRNAGTVERWIAGDICNEFILRDFGTSIANQLNVQFRVRLFSGYDGIRVDTVMENCWTEYRGNLTYGCSLILGQVNPQVVFDRSEQLHYYCSRWHKVFWQDSTPPESEIRYNTTYLSASGLLPNYDPSLAVPESAINSAYNGWLGSAHDIMQPGIVVTYFPQTGGRQEIGLYPAWTARYIYAMDNRLRDIMLNCADVAGTIPIHFRESDASRSFVNHVIRIDDRPTIWVSDPSYMYTAAADKLPINIGSTTTIWSVDLSHQASFAYVPYLVTGDYFYLEEMYFWAGYNLADGNYAYRQGATGLIKSQTRGEAWAIRNVADAANMAPDAEVLEKDYLTEKVNNNLNYWITTYITSGNYPSMRYWSGQIYNDGALQPNSAELTSPWMDDFVLITLGHLKDIGFEAGALVDWLGDSIIHRFHHPDFNWFRGADYHISTKYLDPLTGTNKRYATWADVNASFSSQPGPSGFPNPDSADSYRYIARAALAQVTHLPDGLEAWNWLNDHLHSQAGLNSTPTFAMIPPATTLAGDINDDGTVSIADLQILVAAWASYAGPPAAANWNADADCNGDDIVNIGDLQLLVANWGSQRP